MRCYVPTTTAWGQVLWWWKFPPPGPPPPPFSSPLQVFFFFPHRKPPPCTRQGKKEVCLGRMVWERKKPSPCREEEAETASPPSPGRPRGWRVGILPSCLMPSQPKMPAHAVQAAYVQVQLPCEGREEEDQRDKAGGGKGGLWRGRKARTYRQHVCAGTDRHMHMVAGVSRHVMLLHVPPVLGGGRGGEECSGLFSWIFGSLPLSLSFRIFALSSSMGRPPLPASPLHCLPEEGRVGREAPPPLLLQAGLFSETHAHTTLVSLHGMPPCQKVEGSHVPSVAGQRMSPGPSSYPGLFEATASKAHVVREQRPPRHNEMVVVGGSPKICPSK